MAMMTEMKTQGMSARKLLGKDVVGNNRDKIGDLDDLILNSNTGCAMFGVVDEGGVLGMGERHHVVPWEAFSWTADERLMVPYDQDKIRNAPVLDRSQMPDWGNETWQRQIYDYYGLKYEPGMTGMGKGMTGQGMSSEQGTMSGTGTGMTGGQGGQGMGGGM